MQENLQNKLHEEYPNIFISTDIESGMTTKTYLSVGDGWYNLIENLCNHIQSYIKSKNAYIDFKIKKGEASADEKLEDVKAIQIKEKFGGLRFYVAGGDDYIRGLIDMTESMSFTICETCGEKGKPFTEGWITTLCSKHTEEHKKNLEAKLKPLTTNMNDVTVAP